METVHLNSDHFRIHVDRVDELQYWAQAFHVDEQTVKDAVAAAGTRPAVVRLYIETMRGRGRKQPRPES
jgi:hypothetical protein